MKQLAYLLPCIFLLVFVLHSCSKPDKEQPPPNIIWLFSDDHAVRRHEGVADGRFKLIRFYGWDVPDGEEWELYDLEKDPHEMQNVYSNSQYINASQSLKTALAKLRKQYKVVEMPQIDGRKESLKQRQKNNFKRSSKGLEGLRYSEKRSSEGFCEPKKRT